LILFFVRLINDHFPNVFNVNTSSTISCLASIQLKIIKDIRFHVETLLLEVIIKGDVDATTILADESFHLDFLNERNVHHVSKMDSSSILSNWNDFLILKLGALHG
jgi:hypothetical protein